VLIDAPDIDSVEHDNRALADTLLEVADLCLFLTTATRYADRVPWDVLARIEQRGLPLLVVVNRLPAGAEAGEVLEDVRRLVSASGLRGIEEPGSDDEPRIPVLVAVREGDLADGERLRPDTVAALRERIERLAMDRTARRALAEQALAGALAGVAPLSMAVADDLERAAAEADHLRAVAAGHHGAELRRLLDQLTNGTLLREEVIRQWHSFVGADQVTRLFASGIGRVRGAVLAFVRGTPPVPAATVQEGATDDLVAHVEARAAEAARRTAGDWSGDAWGAALVARDAALWHASTDLPARTRQALDAWLRDIAADVASTGATKRGLARGLSLGVNAGAVTIMLGVFAHTGGVTGTEAGIAAATAFLNQKLLNAVFGEAAVQEMIERARDGLFRGLEGVMGDELARFERLVPDARDQRELAADLREVAGAARPHRA
jgi:hypothetical protein